MTQNELASIWHHVLSDLREPDLLWQLAALAACLLLAKLGERLLLGRSVGAGRAWELGRGGLKRVAFPLLALMLLLAVRPLAQQWMHVGLFSLALPLLGSLAIIRLVFYVLRLSLVGATWLLQFERIFAGLVWAIVALHITGLLPDLIAMLESISFSTGKQKLTLWHLLQGIAAVLVTVLLALWAAGAVEARLNAATGLDSNLRVVFARLSKALLILLAVLIGLPMVGIDLTTLSVFGGALGVGLGLGLQRIASNYVSGFIILLDNSIRIGNVISVGSDRGEVTRITTRYTVVKNITGVEALVPNELLVGSVVQNESYSDPRMRIGLAAQVSYDSDLERAMAIMLAAARGQARVLADPAPVVLLREFADSGINLELGVWIADPQNGTGQLRSDINLAIWREFKRSGISIPFPQREIRILNEGVAAMSETRLIHGFHAVTAKLRHAADDVREITVTEGRQDGRMRDLLKLAEAHGVRVILSDAKRLDGLAGGSQHQGVVAKVAAQAKHVTLDDVLDGLAEPPLLLVLDGVTDPHNLGACLRVADAAGAHAVVAPKDKACGLNATVIKVASGAADTVPYIVVTNLARSLREMQERGIWVIGAAGEADKELYAIDQKGPCAWVLGAEGDGMRRLTRETCDELAKIPMHGSVESLNVSVSAGICLFEARRQRGR